MVENKINMINGYLKKRLRMNFKVNHIAGSAVEISGYSDEGEKGKMRIVFSRPYMVQCAFSFTYKGKGGFMSLAAHDEKVELNKKYGIIKGNTIFRISNEDVNDVMYIAAEGIDVEIMN